MTGDAVHTFHFHPPQLLRISTRCPHQADCGLLPNVPALGEQFADVHHSSSQVTGLKGGGAHLDGASLPPAMILRGTYA